MRTIIATLAVVIVIAVLGGLGFIYSGVYHVGATDRHLDLTYWVLDTTRLYSIRAHAAGIAVPLDLDDRARIVMGTGHFAAHCAVCHGAPGVPKGDIGVGLYPPAPDLANAARRYNSAELFWILKNGIKMSGMPAWYDHSDEELWATVAFLQKLPGMSEEDYGKLVMATMAHGTSHHHAGDEEGRPGPTSPDGHEQH
jgi:mono/diheme cytochrome c family protein